MYLHVFACTVDAFGEYRWYLYYGYLLSSFGLKAGLRLQHRTIVGCVVKSHHL